jgi:hypothetical protein
MEDAMMRQRHEAHFAEPLTSVFGAVVDIAARGRWGAGTLMTGAAQPRAGCQYAQQRGKVFRRGSVLECLRPVSIKLQETLLDPPCCVRLRLHWRLEPLEGRSHVLLEARYSLNGAAVLRRKHWQERIHGHCSRMLGAITRQLAALEDVQRTNDPRSLIAAEEIAAQMSRSRRTIV